jgi:hypothetical protein
VKNVKLSLVLAGIMVLGMVIFYGCSGGGGTPGGGLSFFTGGSGGVSATGSPSPTVSPTSSPAAGEKVLATGRTNTFDLAINAGYAYWTEKSGGNAGGVFRAKTDGTSTTAETVSSGWSNTYSLAFVGSDIYFTQKLGAAQGTIMRVSPSGTLPATATTYMKGLTNPIWIRYNVSDGYLYFLQYSAAGGSLCRIKPGIASPVATDVQIVCNKFVNPYALFIEPIGGRAYVGEMAGTQTSRLMYVNINDPVDSNQNPTVIYSGNETYYITSITVDTVNSLVYWTNYSSNSGVWRMAQSATKPEAVETGIANAFYLYGPAGTAIWYSLNVQRVQNGSIYGENITDVTKPAVNILGPSTTATTPLVFVLSGGNFYWTEFPGFDPTDLDVGGGQQCRVMRASPVTTP